MVMQDEMILYTAHGILTLGRRCLVVGILNVTPDSFSDGGSYPSTANAVRRGREIVAQGADVIDIGGESTRPGAEPVPPTTQLERILPVISELRAAGVNLPISVDTQSAQVAEAALQSGADIVNDISAARSDPEMKGLLAQCGAPVVIMHMQGTPQTMQRAPYYVDVVAEIRTFIEDRVADLEASGLDPARIIIDPGIGFGKTVEHNLEIIRRIADFRGRFPVMVGPSRKAFIGKITQDAEPQDRLMGTAAVVAHCALAGVEMVRIHDVREIRQVTDVCAALRKTLDEPTPPTTSRSL